MPIVPVDFRRQELSTGETKPNHSSPQLRRECCRLFAARFPCLDFILLVLSFSGIERRVPGVQFPSPIKAWDIQLPGGDVTRPPFVAM